MNKPAFARIYGLVARGTRKAVVFRRGPSKQVLLLSWDLERDELFPGQWLKGRIYERRSDLSPDGSKLVYFAANQHPPVYTWTAVSNPPWLTARHFFPKGDTWGGGGLFETDRLLRLNHGIDPALAETPADQKAKRLPRYMRNEEAGHNRLTGAGLNFGDLKITGFDKSGGKGEDEPILARRLKRDGWTASDILPDGVLNAERDKALFVKSRPLVRTKKSPKSAFSLCVVLHGPHEKNGAWNIETAHLIGSDGKVSKGFGRIDWADFDHNGDVLFSQTGCLYRLSVSAAQRGDIEQASVVADLNDHKFEERVAPY